MLNFDTVPDHIVSDNLHELLEYIAGISARGGTYLDLEWFYEVENKLGEFCGVLIGDLEFNYTENKEQILEHFSHQGYAVFHIAPSPDEHSLKRLGATYYHISSIAELPDIVFSSVVSKRSDIEYVDYRRDDSNG